MFTLYVHPGINYTYPEHSLFFGRAIKERAAVEWGQWGVVHFHLLPIMTCKR